MTPEGKVKAMVKLALRQYKIINAAKAGTDEAKDAVGWYTMPTPRGVKGIPDIIGHYYGRFFSIEAKAPGKEPSGFQLLQNDTIKHTGAAAFIIDGEAGLLLVREWLKRVRMWR